MCREGYLSRSSGGDRTRVRPSLVCRVANSLCRSTICEDSGFLIFSQLVDLASV